MVETSDDYRFGETLQGLEGERRRGLHRCATWRSARSSVSARERLLLNLVSPQSVPEHLYFCPLIEREGGKYEDAIGTRDFFEWLFTQFNDAFANAFIAVSLSPRASKPFRT